MYIAGDGANHVMLLTKVGAELIVGSCETSEPHSASIRVLTAQVDAECKVVGTPELVCTLFDALCRCLLCHKLIERPTSLACFCALPLKGLLCLLDVCCAVLMDALCSVVLML